MIDIFSFCTVILPGFCTEYRLDHWYELAYVKSGFDLPTPLANPNPTCSLKCGEQLLHPQHPHALPLLPPLDPPSNPIPIPEPPYKSPKQPTYSTTSTPSPNPPNRTPKPPSAPSKARPWSSRSRSRASTS